MIKVKRLSLTAAMGALGCMLGCASQDPAATDKTGGSNALSADESHGRFDQSDAGLNTPEVSPPLDPNAAAESREPVLPVCSDGQIVAIVRASNELEILVSQSVIDRLENEEARALAQRIIDDHTRLGELLQRLIEARDIEPVENANSREILEMAQLEIEALSALSGRELDVSYVTHQLLDHLQVLGLLDHLLLPSADDPALTAFLQSGRAVIALHEVLSVEVQRQLVGLCGGELDKHACNDTPE